MKKIIYVVVCLFYVICILVGCTSNKSDINVENIVKQTDDVKNINEDVEKPENDDIDNYGINIKNIKDIKKYSHDIYPNMTINDIKVDTIKFGRYSQNDVDNIESIEWILLGVDKENKKALFLSKYILDCRRFDETNIEATWENCSLHNWLKNEFFNSAFDEKEKKNICEVNIMTDNKESKENIFLLDSQEYNDYADSVGLLTTCATKFAKTKNIHVNQDKDRWYYGNSGYWLRDKEMIFNTPLFVSSGGTACGTVAGALDDTQGIRPAIWIKYLQCDDFVNEYKYESKNNEIDLNGSSIQRLPDGSIVISGGDINAEP